MLWSVGACHGKCMAYQLLVCMRSAISLVILYIYSQFKTLVEQVVSCNKKIIESSLFSYMRKFDMLWLSVYLVYFGM